MVTSTLLEQIKSLDYAITEVLEWHQDKGPDSEGWQSNELLKHIEVLRELLEDLKLTSSAK